MPQSFGNLNVHIVFSTKNRQPLITPDFAADLYSYIGGIVRNRKCTLLKANGMADHAHLLVRLARDISVADLVGAVKANATGWVHDTVAGQPDFAWQQGYAAFSVSRSALDDVGAYIDNQTEHHRMKTFQEEYRQFLDRHEIEYDEKWMWE